MQLHVAAQGVAPHIATLRHGARPQRLEDNAARDLAQIGRSEPTTVGKLAEALVMDSGALAHTLKPLERDGLLAVVVDPEDRRNRLITLTRHGRTKLAETDALWASAQRGFEAAFGAAESDTLREALRFLISDGFAIAFEKTLSDPAP